MTMPEVLENPLPPYFYQEPKGDWEFKSVFVWLHWKWRFSDSCNLMDAARRAYAFFMSAEEGTLYKEEKTLSADHLFHLIKGNTLTTVIKVINPPSTPTSTPSFDPRG